jgi:hypothetical protein
LSNPKDLAGLLRDAGYTVKKAGGNKTKAYAVKLKEK